MQQRILPRSAWRHARSCDWCRPSSFPPDPHVYANVCVIYIPGDATCQTGSVRVSLVRGTVKRGTAMTGFDRRTFITSGGAMLLAQAELPHPAPARALPQSWTTASTIALWPGEPP